MIVACIALGFALRVSSGYPLSDLAHLRLRGEPILLGLLVTQAALPAISLSGWAARIAFAAWLATFPLLVGVAWQNRRQAGMAVLAVGLALNFAVIAFNGGMPVFPEAVTAVSRSVSSGAIPAGDFVHVLGLATTRLPWLADVMPIPGPPWLRFVPSAGDLLLYTGVVAFLAGARPASGHVSTRGK
jgi:hypothetical protein